MQSALTGLGLAVLLVGGIVLILWGARPDGSAAITGSILILAFVIGINKFVSRSGD